MQVAVVIPARFGSTRFPGKPLTPILGRSLIERTWRIARVCKYGGDVWVATDSRPIAAHVESFGGRAVMTRGDCQNGTERVCDALAGLGLEPGVVVNLQGDAVLTPPWVIDAVVSAMLSDPSIEVATPATRLDWRQYEEFAGAGEPGRAGGTTVTFDATGDALYFSKALIPSVRRPREGVCPVFRHIGLYAYRPDALARLQELAPGPLEQSERLEQLRALEHGIPIRVVEVDYRGRTHWSIDHPADVAVVERIIRREGELAP